MRKGEQQRKKKNSSSTKRKNTYLLCPRHNEMFYKVYIISYLQFYKVNAIIDEDTQNWKS